MPCFLLSLKETDGKKVPRRTTYFSFLGSLVCVCASPHQGSLPKMQNQQQPKPQGQGKQGMHPPTKIKPAPTIKIQQMLMENAHILQAIVEAQALGRWEDSVKYQQLAHKNLTYLAALADAQQRSRGLKPGQAGLSQMAQSKDHHRSEEHRR